MCSWHITGQMHLLKAKGVDSSCKITLCLVTEKDSLTMNIVKAEVKFTCFYWNAAFQ